jgi:hypothetical protein
MPSRLFLFEFPDGETEYRTSATRPEPGDVLKRRGQEFAVSHVGTDNAGVTVVKLRGRSSPETKT